MKQPPSNLRTPPSTPKPNLRAAGLKWRPQLERWVAYWCCPDAIKKLGYPVTSQRLWAGIDLPAEDAKIIAAACLRLQAEARAWKRAQSTGYQPAGKRRVGTIYFVRCAGLIKIGFTTRPVAQRIRQYGVGAQAIHFIGCMPGSHHIEQFLHWQFRRLRERGEWFRPEEPLLGFITENVPGENLDRGLDRGPDLKKLQEIAMA